MKIKKVLVANRGEIACRIIKTLSDMHIKSVAVYSDVDSNSLHVNMAEEAVYLGSGALTNNYLNITAICNAAIQTGVDAIHPGFGFLSENPDFVIAVQEAGLIFIGPDYKAVKLMGDKLSAKRIASKAGVNVVKGYIGEVTDVETAQKISKDIGFPVLIKAVAGGGGKGMRKVHSVQEVEEAYRIASSESLKSFNDNRIFIEQYIEDPRHIEIQVIADKYGNIVCLGERECSIQRRHQKIIEETPSVFIDHRTRQNMYDQSKILAKQIGYHSVGTVEFIVDHKKKFYFLEMNTRLQVEHPVTELVYGLDIVKEMVQIAEGRYLGYTQESVQCNGWAIEARIYAEDPTKDFFPCSGRLLKYREPTGCNIRIDSGVREADFITANYDPMIAKLCVHADNREVAVARMQNALSQFIIYGIGNNILFLESVLNHPSFINGDTTTNFIINNYSNGFAPFDLDQDCLYLFIGVICYLDAICYPSTSVYRRDLDGLYSVRISQEFYSVFIAYVGEDNIHVEIDDQLLFVQLINSVQDDLVYNFRINEKPYSVKVYRIANHFQISYKGMICNNANLYPPEAKDLSVFMSSDSSKCDSDNSVTSSITGMLVKVFVKIGDEVKTGDPLFIIEAMKMENTFYANRNGKISKIPLIEVVTVQEGDVIIEYETKS